MMPRSSVHLYSPASALDVSANRHTLASSIVSSTVVRRTSPIAPSATPRTGATGMTANGFMTSSKDCMAGCPGLLRTVPRTVLGDFRRVAREVGIGLDERQHVVERRDRHDRNAERVTNVLHGGRVALAALHAVERDQHAGRYRARRLDDRHRLANGRAGGDDVVDDHDATLQWRSDDAPALAMILRFLPVVAVWHVMPRGGKTDRGRGGKRDSLVGRTEKLIVFNAGRKQRLRIEPAQAAETRAVAEQSRIE